MSFKIGDKILCINDSVDQDKFLEISRDFQRWVVKGQEYFVRDILFNNGIVTGLLLVDVYNIPIYIKLIDKIQEPAFGTFRFRKLRKNDSEIFISESIKNEKHDFVEI